MHTATQQARFDWALVPPFLAVLERGSLLGAAKALGSSQPTVGRHIAQLEAQLGATLFERTGRGLQPTETAVRLADAARQMEDGAHALERAMSGHEAGVAGSVRITASQPVASWMLPPILVRMQQALPGVQVDLVASNAVDNLLRREADIALRMVRPDQSTLVAKRIGSIHIGAYAERGYLQRHGVPRSIADLLAHRLVGGDRDEAILRGLAQAGVQATRAHFALRTDDLIAYRSLVRAGGGIGFLADWLARDDPALQRVLPGAAVAQFPVWLTVHREIRSSQRIRAVYDFLAAEIPGAL